MLKTIFAAVALTLSAASYATEYHVSKTGNDANKGSVDSPLKTISAAAKIAVPGDIITVHAGTYREWIDPANGGLSDNERITYRAADGERVEIKGSEVITSWTKVGGGVWKVVLPKSFFGDYNPYTDLIAGDWYDNRGWDQHTGEVFLNGKSLYETDSLCKVQAMKALSVRDAEGSRYKWYTESDAENTTIWANFGDANPNKELVEISMRPTCFYPTKQGLNYITISGFDISQAASQWGAPTAEQVGMVATHWNRGWIIENNVIHDTKCSGITLGKERSTGHNVWTADPAKDGSLHYIEVTFRTLRHGWSRENIGSHIVRNNVIFNCDQTAICGSMGAAFSEISGNHIYNICTKGQFTGAEVAGIKFHAAIDTHIVGNRIHNVGRGIWLDWMTQGTRVSRNLMYDNTTEDIFLEVNHGPYVVDNNVLLSPMSLVVQSGGGAFVHNIIGGRIYTWPEPSRFTPYHMPHSTEVAGLSTIFGGDDRYVNNIFVAYDPDSKHVRPGEYGAKAYDKMPLPMILSGNVYYRGTAPYKSENVVVADFDPEVKLTDKGGEVYLTMKLDDAYRNAITKLVDTEMLGKAALPNLPFENSNGTPLKIDADYFGNPRPAENPAVGPFERSVNVNDLKVW